MALDRNSPFTQRFKQGGVYAPAPKRIGLDIPTAPPTLEDTEGQETLYDMANYVSPSTVINPKNVFPGNQFSIMEGSPDKPKPTQIVQQPQGSNAIVGLDTTEKRTEQGKSTKQNEYKASDDMATFRKQFLASNDEKKKEILKALENHPEYADISSYLGHVKSQQDKYQNDLQAELAKHTSRLSQNEEANFWNKLIGALGSIAAGAIGLGTGGDVGGQYKAPDLFPKEEMDKSAQAQHAARLSGIQSKFDTQAKTDATAMKTISDAGVDVNEAAKIMTAMPKDKTGTETKSWEIAKNLEKHQQQLSHLGFKPVGRKESGNDEKIYYNFKEYNKATEPVIGAINKFDSILLNRDIVKTPEEFINKLADYVGSYKLADGKAAGTRLKRAAMLARYKDMEATFGDQAREEMLEELGNLAGANFEKYPDYATAESLGAGVYGLPFSSIVRNLNKGSIPTFKDKKEKQKKETTENATKDKTKIIPPSTSSLKSAKKAKEAAPTPVQPGSTLSGKMVVVKEKATGTKFTIPIEHLPNALNKGFVQVTE